MQLGSKLHSSGTSSNNYKMKVSSSLFFSQARDGSLFKTINHTSAELLCILQFLKRSVSPFIERKAQNLVEDC
jgi:hypothetical protein